MLHASFASAFTGGSPTGAARPPTEAACWMRTDDKSTAVGAGGPSDGGGDGDRAGGGAGDAAREGGPAGGTGATSLSLASWMAWRAPPSEVSRSSSHGGGREAPSGAICTGEFSWSASPSFLCTAHAAASARPRCMRDAPPMLCGCGWHGLGRRRVSLASMLPEGRGLPKLVDMAEVAAAAPGPPPIRPR
jgi:hypothetical protein